MTKRNYPPIPNNPRPLNEGVEEKRGFIPMTETNVPMPPVKSPKK